MGQGGVLAMPRNFGVSPHLALPQHERQKVCVIAAALQDESYFLVLQTSVAPSQAKISARARPMTLIVCQVVIEIYMHRWNVLILINPHASKQRTFIKKSGLFQSLAHVHFDKIFILQLFPGVAKSMSIILYVPVARN